MYFERKFKMKESITILEKDLGVIEYGFDIINGGYMQFYSQKTYDYKLISDSSVLPDEIKRIETKNPLDIINEVYMWGSDIRRSLVPKQNIIVKKESH